MSLAWLTVMMDTAVIYHYNIVITPTDAQLWGGHAGRGTAGMYMGSMVSIGRVGSMLVGSMGAIDPVG